MITRMSKVEIVGPTGLLQDVVSQLRQLRVIQLEPEQAPAGGKEIGEEKIRPFLHDERERTLFERLFLEDLRRRINDLFAVLPHLPVRISYVEPRSGSLGKSSISRAPWMRADACWSASIPRRAIIC